MDRDPILEGKMSPVFSHIPRLRLNLKARLYFLALAPLIPAFLLILYGAVEQKNSAVQLILNNANHLANKAADREAQLLEDVHLHLRTTSDLYLRYRNGPLAAELGSFLAALRRNMPGYRNLGVVGLDGKLRISAEPLPAGADYSDRHWFKRVLAFEGMAMGDYHLDRPEGGGVVVIAEPVVASPREVTAVVFAELEVSWLNRSLFGPDPELPSGARLIQIDPRGSALSFEAEEGSWSPTSKVTDAVARNILSQGRGVVEGKDAEGVARIYAFASIAGPLKSRRLSVTLSIPRQQAFARANRVLIRNLILLGIVTAVVVLTARWLGELFVLRRVNVMLDTARRLTSGDLSARIAAGEGTDELSRLAGVFDEMAATIERRMKQERETRERIHRSREQLRQLALHLQEIREEERTRIAREMHDHFGQSLSVLKMDLSWLKKRLPAEPPDLHDKLGAMASVIDSTLHMVHAVCAELRPVILDDFGLAAAIEWQAEEFRGHTGIECEVHVPDAEIDLNKDQSTAMFRIFQEALTNVVRHAQATRVTVRLEREDHRVVLVVEDNGRGIMPEEIESNRSFGVIGIRERLYPWSGEVRFAGYPGKGTRVEVSLPEQKKARRHD